MESTGEAGAVDLRSDTVTRPPEAMRRAMAGAPVGDDVLDGDPTVGRLEERVAGILGKEDALFFPSGTQANQTALAVHTGPGQEVVIEEEAHVFHYELGAPARFWGVQLRPVSSDRGRVGRADYEPALRPGDRYHPRTGLLWTENTHNAHGGTVPPLEGLREVRALARERGVPVHLDGARLWNASVASGTPPEAWGGTADTVTVSLSKGLGCPVGSLLAGPGEAMERAW
ncbi:MAG: low specificity L-threonine aldolase [Gemmatimonadota bacterium]